MPVSRRHAIVASRQRAAIGSPFSTPTTSCLPERGGKLLALARQSGGEVVADNAMRFLDERPEVISSGRFCRERTMTEHLSSTSCPICAGMS